MATFVFAVEVHVTRARSLPKIKARFHILMLVSCLCDQNDQLSFLGVEVHVTRASSLPKIKARFHIFMLVSWLCDQNDQLWFLGSKFTLCNSTHIALVYVQLRPPWFEKVEVDFGRNKHETSIKMWKRALIFGRERALVTWTSTAKTKVATKQAFVCSRSVCVKRLT